ncbi:PREDICTED: 16.9 kDa class I heat shock protein 1-like [Nelumbo nucifera]|uniref:16.9 kDa class I heat shock protein 1-like n=2 Tax=Nelumbo nucifera TaxID=4432 RepID=A0A1U8AH10_NELNU|nr:PREDICTED: 16.9 kDa class I heat shock protein 1-like [Nelumbo nucifera]DAD40185.1 TPA_asm: hypothetical protein HUJ06_014508 [Nelumbo nucifera]
MTTLGPWLGGRRGGFDNGFFGDIRNPFDLGSSGWGKGDRDDDTSVLAQTNVDWRETDNAHIFRADLPGVRKEELKVQVEENNIIEICGERSKEEENKGDTWHRVERRRGSFMRRFRLPENANMAEIKCKLEDGVLTVTVPKKETEPVKKKVRAIDVA